MIEDVDPKEIKLLLDNLKFTNGANFFPKGKEVDYQTTGNNGHVLKAEVFIIVPQGSIQVLPQDHRCGKCGREFTKKNPKDGWATSGIGDMCKQCADKDFRTWKPFRPFTLHRTIQISVVFLFLKNRLRLLANTSTTAPPRSRSAPRLRKAGILSSPFEGEVPRYSGAEGLCNFNFYKAPTHHQTSPFRRPWIF